MYGPITVVSTLLGLLVNSLDLPSKLGIVKEGSAGSVTQAPSEILKFAFNPVVIFVVWGVAFIAYLGYLRNYWEEKRVVKEVQASFVDFLVDDIVGLRKPFYFIILLFILAFLIKSSLEAAFAAAWYFGLIIIAAYLVAGFFSIKLLINKWKEIIDNRKIQQERMITIRAIERNWPDWSRVIQMGLANNWFVDQRALYNTAQRYGVNITDDIMDHIFLKYEAEHMPTAKYVYVHRKSDGEPLLYRELTGMFEWMNIEKIPVKILIDTRKFPYKDYTYEY